MRTHRLARRLAEALMLLAVAVPAVAGEAAPDSAVAAPDSGIAPADSAVAPGGSAAVPPSPGETPDVAPPPAPLTDPESIPAVDVVFVLEEHGAFRIRLDRERTPNHVAAFLSLAASGFYDGLGFHRIIPEYLVQIGDPSTRDMNPLNDGFTAPEWKLPAEGSDRTHVAGTVSMAWRGSEPGTAGTQWLVSLGVLPALDDHATPIGEIVEGMDAIEGMSQLSTLRNRHPLHPVRVQRTLLVPQDAPTPPLDEDRD